MSSTALIPVESVNAAELFAGDGLDGLLSKIREHAISVAADVTTDKGRKEIASIAYKVARSKTTIDDAGKSLVADWKAKSAAVDAARKKARDYLDALKDEVRQPLTDWEAEQERIAEEAREAERKRIAEAEAARLADIERREAEIRAKEEAIRKAEEEARAKAEAERIEKERIAREERIRVEASERAEREKLAALEAAKLAEERAAREAEQAKERERLAAETAERDKQEAVRQAEEKAKREAEQKERARLADEAAAKAEEQRRAADREHRQTVNAAALKALVDEGVGAATAKKVLTLIASGAVPRVSINY